MMLIFGILWFWQKVVGVRQRFEIRMWDVGFENIQAHVGEPS